MNHAAAGLGAAKKNPLLTLEGCNVVAASTGKDGLCEAARVAPQSVLLDYHLPDIDGLTWLRTLRRQQARTKPFVVLFTADWEVEIDEPELVALGATMLSKLCDLDDVRRLVLADERHRE